MNGATYKDKVEEKLYSKADPSEWEQKELHDIEGFMRAMHTIIDFSNVMGRRTEHTAEIMLDSLELSHRTLQQSTVSSMIQALLFYADARCDGRNEYAVKTCKAIKEALTQGQFLYDGRYDAPCI